jgi:hypothetical protein
MAKAAKSLAKTTLKWSGAIVSCYIRDMHDKRRGPVEGVVRGISTNQKAVEDEGGAEYNATGLLVDIPELGRNITYGQWPVRFDDATIIR